MRICSGSWAWRHSLKCINCSHNKTYPKILGHPQPPTPIHTDNKTVCGITNNMLQKRKSNRMNMQYFWIIDRIKQNQCMVILTPGQENLADYATKQHPAVHHKQVQPYDCSLQTTLSLLPPPRALSPSAMQGYIDNLRTDHLELKTVTLAMCELCRISTYHQVSMYNKLAMTHFTSTLGHSLRT